MSRSLPCARPLETPPEWPALHLRGEPLPYHRAPAECSGISTASRTIRHLREGSAGASMPGSRNLAGREKRQSRRPARPTATAGHGFFRSGSRDACPLLDDLDEEVTVQSRRFSHILDQCFELTFGADDV